MARLSEHLKFFIAKKIEEDLSWRTIRIIFSGHEVLLGFHFEFHLFFFYKFFPLNAYEVDSGRG